MMNNHLLLPGPIFEFVQQMIEKEPLYIIAGLDFA